MENSNSMVKAGLVLALALAFFFGFLYFKEKKISEKKSFEFTEKTKDILKTNAKLDSLANEIHIKISELAAMGGRIDELENLKLNLENDKRLLLSSNSINLQEYQKKIKRYENLINEKEFELQQFRVENGKLKKENTDLSSTNSNLQNVNVQLQGEKDGLYDSLKRYAEDNRQLKEKVTLGAALRPVNYLVTAINKRGRKRDGDEFKSRRVDQIKVSFKLAENPLTKQDNKVLYLRLLDPYGNVFSDMSLGSGIFTFGGKETVYTTKQVVKYTNSNQLVEFVYDKENKYEKGHYKIEIYAEGFRVGQTTFSIK